MELKDLKESHKILECIAGSRAYGTNVPESDTDIRGIYLSPLMDTSRVGIDGLLGKQDEISDKKNDIKYFELRRFFELAADCDVAIIELMWMPESSIVLKTPIYDKIVENREMFLSTKAFHTFNGYAYQQIKKAKGQNKWINNPQPKDPPSKLSHAYFIDKDDKSMRARPILDCGLDLDKCKVANATHVPNSYHLYADGNGIFKGSSQHLSPSHVEKDEIPLGLLIYNDSDYEKGFKNWKNYWTWRKERNEDRYKNQENGITDYDCKNMMHCLRILKSGASVLRGDGPIVRVEGEDLSILMDVRNGLYAYKDIEALANKEKENLEAIKKISPLRKSANRKALNNLYLELRYDW